MLPYSQPLTQYNVLETDDIDAAGAKLSEVYGEVILAPIGHGNEFALRLNAAPLGRLTIISMLWNSGFEARSPHLDGCFDFCSGHSGGGEIRIGGKAVDINPRQGAVMSPVDPMQCQANERLVSLNVKVPQNTAEAHLRALTGNDIARPLDFESEMRLDGHVAGAWRLLHYVVSELERDPSLLSNPLVKERFSDTLLTSLLCSQPHNYSHLLQKAPHAAEPAHLRRVEEYVESHCDQPITAELLAKVAGISVSALYAGFKRHREYTPLDFLKQMRLRAVRDALLVATSGTTVTSTASRWGFTHLGRFSRDYQANFGELPSETLRRASD